MNLNPDGKNRIVYGIYQIDPEKDWFLRGTYPGFTKLDFGVDALFTRGLYFKVISTGIDIFCKSRDFHINSFSPC